MRFKNTKGVLKLYAVAGTQTVLLSFDLDAKLVKKKEFLGFSIERIDPFARICGLQVCKLIRAL